MTDGGVFVKSKAITTRFCDKGMELCAHETIRHRIALRWTLLAYGPKDLSLSDMIKYCARQTKDPGQGGGGDRMLGRKEEDKIK